MLFCYWMRQNINMPKKIVLSFSSSIFRKGKHGFNNGGCKISFQGTCFFKLIIILVLNYLLSLSSLAFAFRDRSLGE